MDKMVMFCKSQAKFHEAITVPNSKDPMFTTMSVTIRRQQWTNVNGGNKPFAGDEVLKVPEVTVIATSKERVLADMVELFDRIGNDVDSSDMLQAAEAVGVEKAVSAWKFMSNFTMNSSKEDDAADSKGYMKMILQGMMDEIDGKTEGKESSGSVSAGAGGPTEESINWCLAGRGLLSKAVDRCCEDMRQQRGAKKAKQVSGANFLPKTASDTSNGESSNSSIDAVEAPKDEKKSKKNGKQSPVARGGLLDVTNQLE